VTGATTGLGLSLSRQLIQLGFTVYGVSKTKRHWPAARKKIQNSTQFLLTQTNVTSEKSVKRLLGTIYKKEKRLDLLVNNAGYANKPTRFEKHSLLEFEKNLTQNLSSVFLMCKHALPFLRKQKKSWVVNLSSMAGKRAVPLLSAYSASKFGVVALSQSLAKENENTGIQFITVCPGGINTEMRVKLFGTKDANRQQSPDFVASKIVDILQGKIKMASGDDIVIRHGRVTAINPLPGA